MKTIITAVLTLVSFNVFAVASTDTQFSFEGRTSVYPSAPSECSQGAVCYESPASDVPADDYDHVFLVGVMPDPNTVLQIAGASSHYSDWTQIRYERSASGNFWASIAFSKPRKEAIKIRATGKKDLGTFMIHEASYFKLADVQAAEHPQVSSFSSNNNPAPTIKIITRKQWGAKAPTTSYTPQNPYRITVHHTAMSQPMDREDGIAEMRAIQKAHQDGHGWIDVGYHYLIDGAGNIYQGRPYNVQGAHVESYNEGNIGISIMGYFHAPVNNELTQATSDALVALLKNLMETQHIPVDELFAHRDLNATACPGDILYPRYLEIKQLLAQQVKIMPEAKYYRAMQQTPASPTERLDSMLEGLKAGYVGW